MIPFCEFGGNISVMGTKIDQIDIPVCSSFRPKIVQDQLCYSVDPNKFRKSLKDELSITLFINYNEDRKFSNKIDLNTSRRYPLEEHLIYVGTIGKFKLLSFLIK